MNKKAIAIITGSLLVLGAATQAQAGVEETYKAKCMACHDNGIAGAPKLGDKDAWAPRIAAGRDAMIATATKGKGAMPPMGTCMECTAEEIAALVDYMVDKSQ